MFVASSGHVLSVECTPRRGQRADNGYRTRMCRLFALTGGKARVRATFWLLEAPDSLAAQSRRMPDGTGLGTYDEQGHPQVAKRPIAAYQDQQFAQEAREACSTTYLAHIRYASTGELATRNTHPFEQDGRLFAHNGVIEGLDLLEEHLGADMELVDGDTDSERFFALVTREARRHGDVGAGLTTAARWVAEHLPLFALNVLVTTEHDVWALRYPETRELYLLERRPGGQQGRHLDHASASGNVRVRSGHLAETPAVVLATEPMDEDPGWTLLRSGELVHVGPDLDVERMQILDSPPARPLALDDLDSRAARSQV